MEFNLIPVDKIKALYVSISFKIKAGPLKDEAWAKKKIKEIRRKKIPENARIDLMWELENET